jgi:predicted nucleotidyltransferase component of viral defense system
MNVSLQFLQRCAAETGYRPEVLEKVIRLGELAGDIGRHPFLGIVLALKGGTALNLCFGTPNRLSVDLDFNYIGDGSREKMQADRPQVEEALEQLGQRRGYRIQRSADAFAGRKLYLTYGSVLGHQDRIETDLNFLFRTPIGMTGSRVLWQPGGLDQPVIPVVSLDELCIGKVLALLDRAAARDAWDVARLPEIAGDSLSSGLFRSRLIVLSAILDHPLETYKRRMLEKRIDDRSIAEHLIPMLSGSASPETTGLVERAWTVVEPFLKLTPEEREYTAAIQRGELRTDLLFPDNPEAAKSLGEHPAIQWKLLNVREHLTRNPATI